MAEQRVAVSKSIESFATFSSNAADASAQLPQLMTRVDTAVSTLQTMADDISLATREVREQIHAGGDSLQTLGGRTLPEMEALLAEMRQLTSSFQRLSDRLEEDPRAVLYGPQLVAPGPGE
jgi:ABC-type transporter Mla subunit MlaD